MTTKRSRYKTYTEEFKAEAVRLMQATDRPESASSAKWPLVTLIKIN